MKVNDDIRIISARNYQEFKNIVHGNSWNERHCIFVSGNTTLEERWARIMGYQVLSGEQLIGFFTIAERNYLMRKTIGS